MIFMGYVSFREGRGYHSARKSNHTANPVGTLGPQDVHLPLLAKSPEAHRRGRRQENGLEVETGSTDHRMIV